MKLGFWKFLCLDFVNENNRFLEVEGVREVFKVLGLVKIFI